MNLGRCVGQQHAIVGTLDIEDNPPALLPPAYQKGNVLGTFRRESLQLRDLQHPKQHPEQQKQKPEEPLRGRLRVFSRVILERSPADASGRDAT